MTRSAHPHGLPGWVLDDAGRTERAVRLMRAMVWPAMLALLVVAGATVAVAFVSPAAAVGVLGSGLVAVAGGTAVRTRRRRARVGR